jgi:hypothetical protein
MVNLPSTNILLSPLGGMDSKARKCLGEIQTYLEINGNLYSQSSDNIDRPKRTEYHYFMGDSVVKITTFIDKANIEIVSHKTDSLLGLKKSIESFLNKD